ncbi:MAG TPA: nuclear transport factor 2 family protein [Candidatus Angelobacter sp.]|nr:nuclear transport factor 2 family protein [Candidatus Angelobacter sp.]
MPSPIASQPVTKAEVEYAVRNYWTLSTSKQAELQQGCYADNALVFTSSSRRLEPGRLVLMRRQREYMSTGTKLKVEVGRIEVELIGVDAAMAVYIMQLDAEQKSAVHNGVAKIAEEHLQHARVTHIFVRSADGKLKIVHEHISVPNN